MTAIEDALLEQYERFTSVLCLAAQYGVDARREQAYTEVRAWMRDYHGEIESVLKRAAIADPLFALLESETLRELLDADEGDLIANVGKISEALYAAWE